MSDREAMKLALEALEAVMPFSTTQRGLKIKAVEALRTHLDAPRPEPVAFDFQKAFRLAFNLGQNYGIDAESDSRAAHKRADKYRQEFDVLCADALAHAALAAPSLAVTVDPRLTTDEAAAISSALAAPQPEPTHPGYILGSHWLETAYSRICAGEAEADVLKDCGWERVTDADALRRDAERLREALAWAYNLRHLRGHSDPVVIPERFAPFIEAALRREDKT